MRIGRPIIFLTCLLAIFLLATAAWAGWAGKLNISSSTAWSNKPQVISRAGKVYIVWADSFDVYFKWFNGASWSENIKVNSGDYEATDNPKLALAGGKAHIVWEQLVDSQYEVYYRRFDGSAWSAITNVSQTGGHSSEPIVAAHKANAYIVWEEDSNKDYSSDEILYRKVAGGMLGSRKNLSSSKGSESEEPAISVDGGRVRVVWTENISGNHEILYRSFAP